MRRLLTLSYLTICDPFVGYINGVFTSQCTAHKQENICFDRTILHNAKFWVRLKKIKSGNDRSVERDFPNCGCFQRWNKNCATGTSKLMPMGSRKLKMIFGRIPKEFETTIKKMGQKNGSMFSCKQMEFQERKY